MEGSHLAGSPFLGGGPPRRSVVQERAQRAMAGEEKKTADTVLGKK